MALDKTETEELKQLIVSRCMSLRGEAGSILTLLCDDDGLIWEDVATGEKHYGCGRIIAQFKDEHRSNETWDIAADLYILHVVNDHHLKADIGLLTD